MATGRIDLGTYGDKLFELGIPGMDADINISSIVSYTNGTDEPVDVGVAVGVNEEGRIVPLTASSEVTGVTVRHPVWPANADGEWFYPPNSAVPVMEFGRIWAICVAGCNVGDPVSAETDGTLSVGGALPVTGAFWDSVADAGGIALLRLNRIKLPEAAATPP
ncbi:hypothetical protein AB3X94_37275 [Paraburkholderia sp. BR10923]|uniref:structural cement protein Gp24 n=1 Tax=Paraburkholderia sp. BR10923 TaxID=3236992 RepID=UPI0034CF35A4